MRKPWPCIKSEVVSQNDLFSITIDRAVSPRNNGSYDFYIAHLADWLQIVPLTSDGLLVLVEQYRHGNRMVGLEVPGGMLDPSDSHPRDAAVRELEEETGYGAGEVISIGSLWPQPAMMSNRVHIYFAKNAFLKGEIKQDDAEDVETVLVRPDDVGSLIANGKIHNAMTVTALSMTRQAGLI